MTTKKSVPDVNKIEMDKSNRLQFSLGLPRQYNFIIRWFTLHINDVDNSHMKTILADGD